jgi:hypothetical protein
MWWCRECVAIKGYCAWQFGPLPRQSRDRVAQPVAQECNAPLFGGCFWQTPLLRNSIPLRCLVVRLPCARLQGTVTVLVEAFARSIAKNLQ